MALAGKGSSTGKSCPHTNILSTITAGLVREVCEECGDLSFRYFSELRGEVQRTRFSRVADEDQIAPAPSDLRLVKILASEGT